MIHLNMSNLSLRLLIQSHIQEKLHKFTQRLIVWEVLIFDVPLKKVTQNPLNKLSIPV